MSGIFYMHTGSGEGLSENSRYKGQKQQQYRLLGKLQPSGSDGWQSLEARIKASLPTGKIRITLGRKLISVKPMRHVGAPLNKGQKF